jgi:hypothetical protein
MSLAAETRAAVRRRPLLYDGLRAGIINYTAAAESLALDGDREAVATALRRFAAELSDDEPTSTASGDRSITVRLHSNCESVEAPDTLLAVDGAGIGLPAETSTGDPEVVDTDGQTALRVTGDVDARLLSTILDRFRIAEISVAATGLMAETMVVVVPRRDGPTAVQLIESVAENV